ncbi:P1 family peptidase [Sphingorhabdus sp.]|jgi:L-aminopeptidase/D-esterase-like protein|uniref:P1 family peptidase n=1 Tax=Sphingorhabdus sp. TaxID=1902408 RepID=UPI0037CB1A2C
MNVNHKSGLKLALVVGLLLTSAVAFAKPRARAIGIPFDGIAGPQNTITDVSGVEVGQVSIIRDDAGPHGNTARTGVTIIHPLGKQALDGVAAGFATINGTGEWTGTHLVDEVGGFFGPIALTGTGNVGVVHQSILTWSGQRLPAEVLETRVLPMVAETLDSHLNDIFSMPLGQSDVFNALDNASSGAVAEGNVGGGTGMIAYTFKGGIGTSSRVVETSKGKFTIGVLVQANHGKREDLRIAGIPVGREVTGNWPEVGGVIAAGPDKGKPAPVDKNSLLVVIATDAPLMPHQLERLARRAALGVGRNGSTASNFSGEFALAFSTTTRLPVAQDKIFVSASAISDLDSEVLDGLFAATVQATEEALVNQLVASDTMTGANGATVYALPVDQLIRILRSHGQLVTASKPVAALDGRPPALRRRMDRH